MLYDAVGEDQLLVDVKEMALAEVKEGVEVKIGRTSADERFDKDREVPLFETLRDPPGKLAEQLGLSARPLEERPCDGCCHWLQMFVPEHFSYSPEPGDRTAKAPATRGDPCSHP